VFGLPDAALTAFDPGCTAPIPGMTDCVAVVDDAL
jgi:hypothetical protein